MMENPNVFREKQNAPAQWIQALIGAFSTYSTIPVPEIEFTPTGLRYVLNAFPAVGTLLGLILGLWLCIGHLLHFSPFLLAVIAFILNQLLTGAIHLDGFADAMDAIFSRRDQEEQLRIMKDPHIGPMAVIALISYALLETAFFAEIMRIAASKGRILQTALNLVLFWTLGRALSGRMVLDLPKVREGGMAQTMSALSGEREIRIQNGLIIALSLLLLPLHGWMALLILPLTALLYLTVRFVFLFKYDGITGDLAGLFYCLEEVFFLLMLLLSLMWR